MKITSSHSHRSFIITWYRDDRLIEDTSISKQIKNNKEHEKFKRKHDNKYFKNKIK